MDSAPVASRIQSKDNNPYSSVRARKKAKYYFVCWPTRFMEYSTVNGYVFFLVFIFENDGRIGYILLSCHFPLFHTFVLRPKLRIFIWSLRINSIDHYHHISRLLIIQFNATAKISSHFWSGNFCHRVSFVFVLCAVCNWTGLSVAGIGQPVYRINA